MQAEGKSYDDINVTPMVDLYLVLLLIFIIMTTAGVQGIKVDLPKVQKKPIVQEDAKASGTSYLKQQQEALPDGEPTSSKASIGLGVGIAAAVAAIGAYLYASRSSK